MYSVETRLEDEYLGNLDALRFEKVNKGKRVESLENRIAHEIYMIKSLIEKMSTISKEYHQDVVSTVEAALAM